MRLGLNLGFLTAGHLDPIRLAVQAERLGYQSVWVAEAWGSDAVSVLAWIGAKTERIQIGSAILQIPSRSPALIAMTAATMDRLSGGRFLLGLGMSGPQVVEGWHGVAYGKPVTKTREVVEILRKIWKREEPLVHHGAHYQIPFPGGTGLGKPLKIMMPPLRPSIPVYLGAIGPRNVALAAEIAEGWLPIFFSPHHRDIFEDSIKEGMSRRLPDLSEAELDIAPTVGVSLGDDLTGCFRALKPDLALYIGGMGSKEKNYYFDLACRYGYESQAATIQALFLAGERKNAAAAVPDDLVDAVSLCGSKERIAERLAAWNEAGVTTLICSTTDITTVRTMAELIL